MQKIRADVTLGKNIQELRLKNKLTQEAVVAQMQVEGCSIIRETYSKIERGCYSIRVKELRAMKRIFKCEFNDFFKGME